MRILTLRVEWKKLENNKQQQGPGSIEKQTRIEKRENVEYNKIQEKKVPEFESVSSLSFIFDE